MKERLEKVLIDQHTPFFICYSISHNKEEKCRILDRIKNELKTEKKNEFQISIGFPGSLMVLYEYEKNQKKDLTKLEYLKQQIELIQKK